jgi:hypothetical protein
MTWYVGTCTIMLVVRVINQCYNTVFVVGVCVHVSVPVRVNRSIMATSYMKLLAKAGISVKKEEPDNDEDSHIYTPKRTTQTTRKQIKTHEATTYFRCKYIYLCIYIYYTMVCVGVFMMFAVSYVSSGLVFVCDRFRLIAQYRSHTQTKQLRHIYLLNMFRLCV